MIRSTVIKQTAVTKEDLQAIAGYALGPLDEKEIFTFKVVLCDNDIDRDGEQFTDEALEKLAPLFLGVTGIFDHDPRGRNQTARIYHTQVETVEGRTNALGEPYRRLKAKAYMVRTLQNQDLILEILGGIKKEVSVGCRVGKRSCSICGADQLSGGCQHHRGEIYDTPSGKARCFYRLEDPKDAYEWSFVAVPAQVNAGVVKGYAPAAEEGEAGEALAEKAAQRKGVWLSAEEYRRLTGEIVSLKARAQDGERYREELGREVIKYAALSQGLSAGVLEPVCQKLDTGELLALKEALRKAAEQRYPLSPQLMPRTPELGREADRFRI